MGFTELLTIVFIVLKLVGVISWSWWLVLLPEIIALAGYLVLTVLNSAIAVSSANKMRKKKSKWL